MTSLLDYALNVTIIPSAGLVSGAYLEQFAIVTKPNATAIGAGDDNGVFLITDPADIITYTDNTEVIQAFNSGYDKVYIINKADLVINDLLNDNKLAFFTVVISTDFTEVEIGLLDKGTFTGVFHTSSSLQTFLDSWVILRSQCGFFDNGISAVGSIHAVVKFLSSHISRTWRDQQYIEAPSNLIVSVNDLGTANNFFNLGYSFYLEDPQLGKHLGGFFQGTNGISLPYIVEQLKIELQNSTVIYLQGKNPKNIGLERARLQQLYKKIIGLYEAENQISFSTVGVLFKEGKFEAGTSIGITLPNPLWKVQANITELVV